MKLEPLEHTSKFESTSILPQRRVKVVELNRSPRRKTNTAFYFQGDSNMESLISIEEDHSASQRS